MTTDFVAGGLLQQALAIAGVQRGKDAIIIVQHEDGDDDGVGRCQGNAQLWRLELGKSALGMLSRPADCSTPRQCKRCKTVTGTSAAILHLLSSVGMGTSGTRYPQRVRRACRPPPALLEMGRRSCLGTVTPRACNPLRGALLLSTRLCCIGSSHSCRQRPETNTGYMMRDHSANWKVCVAVSDRARPDSHLSVGTTPRRWI